jgi:hypothetical protein
MFGLKNILPDEMMRHAVGTEEYFFSLMFKTAQQMKWVDLFIRGLTIFYLVCPFEMFLLSKIYTMPRIPGWVCVVVEC